MRAVGDGERYRGRAVGDGERYRERTVGDGERYRGRTVGDEERYRGRIVGDGERYRGRLAGGGLVKNEVVSLVLATNQEPAVVCILKLQLKTFLEFTRRHGAFSAW